MPLTRSRILALAAVPVLAAGGTTAGVALTSTAAHAAPSGFTYAVGINTGTATITLGHLKSAVVQHNPLTVAKTMTSDEAALASTALGGAAKVGFLVTKTFDDSDKAAATASLVQTAVVNAGLWTYYNGALCDHIQARPAFLASMTHPTVDANVTGGVSEVIQFVARSFIQVVPNTCPAHPAIPTTGTYYAGVISANGASYPLPSILSFAWSQSEQATHDAATAAELKSYTVSTGKVARQNLTITKGIDDSDRTLHLSGDVGSVFASTWTLTQYKAGTRQYTLTVDDPLVVSYSVSSLGGVAPVISLTIAFSDVQLSFPGGS